MTPAQLIAVYPSLDFLMAETILACHENGNLESFFTETEAVIEIKPITIENPKVNEPTKK
jgi:hypothetical protein